MEPIKESAVRLRVDPLNWPAELPRTEYPALSKAMEAAADVFTRFQEERRKNAANKGLTPTGVREADARFAAANLPALAERLATIRRTSAPTESTLSARFTAGLAEPATEPADLAMMQEIRTWLRSLLDPERLTRVRQLAADGDKPALRAVLTAPPYLTGLDEEMLALILDEAAKRNHPERHGKLEAFRQAASAAERALEGVIRYVEQETAGAGSRLMASTAAA